MLKESILSGIVVFVLIVSGCVAGTPNAPTATSTATAVPVTAMPAPSAALSTPVNTISISGTVIDRNGEPVPNALVGVWRGDEAVTTPEGEQHANVSGCFSFSGLKPGDYQVTADVGPHHGSMDMRFSESAAITVVMPDYGVSAVVPGPTGQASISPDMPRFDVTRVDDTTVEVRLASFGEISSLRGLYVKSPNIASPEIIPANRSLGVATTVDITDPNLKKPAHLVASSWVNGQNTVVIDATV